MALVSSIETGTQKIINYGDDVSIFSDSTLETADGWQEVDVSSYVPNGSRSAKVRYRCNNAGDAFVTFDLSIDNGTNVTNNVVGIEAADNSAGALQIYGVADVLLSADRKFYVRAGNDTMGLFLNLIGNHR